MVAIPCTIDGCGWQTADRDPAIFGAILAAELSNHTQGSHVVAVARALTRANLSKPTIGLNWTKEKYNYFSDRWNTYKAATRVAGDELRGHLLDCAEEPLRQAMYRDNENIEKSDENTIMAAIKRLAVRGENKMVSRMTLHSMRQNESETVRNFAARVRGRAALCDFTVKHTTAAGVEETVNYTNSLIQDVVVRGLYDQDIQRELLGHENQDLALEPMLTVLEAKESGRRTQQSLLRVECLLNERLSGDGVSSKQNRPSGSGMSAQQNRPSRSVTHKHLDEAENEEMLDHWKNKKSTVVKDGGLNRTTAGTRNTTDQNQEAKLNPHVPSMSPESLQIRTRGSGMPLDSPGLPTEGTAIQTGSSGMPSGEAAEILLDQFLNMPQCGTQGDPLPKSSTIPASIQSETISRHSAPSTTTKIPSINSVNVEDDDFLMAISKLNENDMPTSNNPGQVSSRAFTSATVEVDFCGGQGETPEMLNTPKMRLPSDEISQKSDHEGQPPKKKSRLEPTPGCSNSDPNMDSSRDEGGAKYSTPPMLRIRKAVRPGYAYGYHLRTKEDFKAMVKCVHCPLVNWVHCVTTPDTEDIPRLMMFNKLSLGSGVKLEAIVHMMASNLTSHKIDMLELRCDVSSVDLCVEALVELLASVRQVELKLKVEVCTAIVNTLESPHVKLQKLVLYNNNELDIMGSDPSALGKLLIHEKVEINSYIIVRMDNNKLDALVESMGSRCKNKAVHQEVFMNMNIYKKMNVVFIENNYSYTESYYSDSSIDEEKEETEDSD